MSKIIILFLSFQLMFYVGLQAEQNMHQPSFSIPQDTAKQREVEEAASRKAAEEKKAAEAKKASETRDPREAAYYDAVSVIETSISGYSLDNVQPTSQMKAELDKKVAKLQQFSDIKITITGHTCDKGSEEVNEKISQQRADAIKAYLVSKGIKESRMKTDAKGKEEPIEPNTNNVNRAVNRRVEFKVN